jgi:hypothetical protein
LWFVVVVLLFVVYYDECMFCLYFCLFL